MMGQHQTPWRMLALCLAVMLLSSSALAQSLYEGRQLPPFTLETLAGEETTVELGDGMPTVLVYVDSGQSRSIELVEDVQRLLSDGQEIRFEVITHKPPEVWDHPVQLLVDSDGALYQEWRVRVFPVAILVDGRGVVHRVFHGYTRTEHERLAGELKVILGEMTDEELDAAMADKPVAMEDMPAEEFVGLGNKHWKAGFIDRAKEAWEKALELNPELDDAHVALAGYYLETGALEEASAQLENPLAHDPDEQTWLLASRIYLAREQLDEAEEAAENALDLNRRSDDAKLALADVYLAHGWPEEASELAAEVLVLKKENARAMYILGRAAELEGNLDEAVKQYRRAFEIEAGGW